ncbi:hypothetical protein [Virgibacillus ainsalahensis]
MKKIWFTLIILFAAILVASFLIPKETQPSADTRIVLEHSKSTYIAPTCFEQSNPTNWLEDATLEDAGELDYPPEGACTEEAMKGVRDSLFISILKDVGILDKKWDNWQ